MRARFLRNACFLNIHDSKFIKCVPKKIAMSSNNNKDGKPTGDTSAFNGSKNKYFLDTSVAFKGGRETGAIGNGVTGGTGVQNIGTLALGPAPAGVTDTGVAIGSSFVGGGSNNN